MDMDVAPGSELCRFIIRMSAEQFRHSTNDEDFADLVLGHLEFCPRHVGCDAKEKFEILVEALVSREIGRQKQVPWKYGIVAAQTREALAEMGIVSPL